MATQTKNAKEIFVEAIEQYAPSQWPEYLGEACGGDAALRNRVEILLKAHVGDESLLDKPAIAPAPTLEQPSERLGTLIGPYKLLEQIGEGGMGLVYMAEQQQPVRRLVALKLVKPGMDSKQVIARFEAERQALAMMDHANIAKVHDAGTTETGRPYFVMELVRGIPINEFCDQQKLTVRQRLVLFIQVCQAVQHAHQKGIIHRDLKPTNVLVTKADTVPLPKVIDFGIAKALGPALTDHTLHTGFAQLVGTPMYMSPEQAEMNCFGVDTRSDVYSLGVLLYELLTGTTPFDKETLSKAGLDEVRRMIREDEPETVSARIAKTRRVGSAHHLPANSGGHSPPYIPHSALRIPQLKELDWIVMKALEKDRSRRYESASSLAADIQRYLSDEPVLACPPTTMYRFQKFARKHKPAFVTAAAIAICLLLGTTVSAWQAVRATTAEAQANANEQKATTERDEAQRQRDEVKTLADKLATKEQELRRTLYAAHMNLARHAWDGGITDQVLDMLQQHRPKGDERDLRGFEWHYFQRLCHSELLTLRPHGGHGIYCVAYSPDGTRVATGSDDGEVKICDAQSGKELLTLKGHTGWINNVAFSPDGKRVGSGSGWHTNRETQKKTLGEVRVWDSQTGRELFAIKDFTPMFAKVAYSLDGKRLACVGGPDWEQGEVRVVDAETGQELLTCKGHTEYIDDVAYSPDGKRLLTACVDGTARLWDAQTGEETLKIEQYCMSAAFSPDGSRLALGCTTGRKSPIKLFDAETGQELLALNGHNGSISDVAFSPDGRSVASASGDRTIRLWDAASGQERFTYKGHTSQVGSVSFSTDGRHLASASHDGTVKIWDTVNGPEPRRFAGPSGPVRDVGVSPDGMRLAIASGPRNSVWNTVKIWDVKTGQELVAYKEGGMKEGSVAAVSSSSVFSPDGQRLATALRGGEIAIWTAETGQELLRLKGHERWATSVAFSRDGRRLASASGDRTVRIWNAETGQELLTIKGHSQQGSNVAFSPDGKRVAASAEGGKIKVWDAETGAEFLVLQGQSGHLVCVAFSPDGNRVATSTDARNVTVWDAQSGRELLRLKGHTSPVGTLVYSPDGKRLASCVDDEVKLWDAETGHELLTIKKAGGRSLIFSPDGHRLIGGGAEGVTIWDATPLSEKP